MLASSAIEPLRRSFLARRTLPLVVKIAKCE